MESYKVLVVEDDELIRKQLARVIRKEGFKVVVAEDGQTGLEIFKSERPEILIADLRMPGMNGLELMHEVRSLSVNVQLIVVTGFGEADTAISALHEGALDYLQKPIDLKLLIAALGRAKEKITEYERIFPFFYHQEPERRNSSGAFSGKQDYGRTQRKDRDGKPGG